MPFYRATACNATHGIAVDILSVRLSTNQPTNNYINVRSKADK